MNRRLVCAVLAVLAVGLPGRAEEAKVEPVFREFVLRDGLAHSYAKLKAGGPVRVAFMGGSVTTQSWREPVMAWLKQQFPQAQFDFIMAGIGGTDAGLGAFRLPRDVFGRGSVDLFFLEFAVNGGGVRPMEGIVRQARRLNPDVDLVLTYFASAGHVADVKAGRVPGIVQEHEQVAEHYGLPALHLYREVANRIAAGALTWEQFSRDVVHPTPLGCELYGACFCSFLGQAFAQAGAPTARGPLPTALDPLCYQHGHYTAPTEAKVAQGFRWVPGWTTKEATCNFAPPVDLLEATEPGAELTFTFTGTALALYAIVGFDAGRLDATLDGKPLPTVELFDHYCTQFHRPQHRLLADGLVDGPHTLTLKLRADHDAKGTGTAARIVQFMVNGAR